MITEPVEAEGETRGCGRAAPGIASSILRAIAVLAGLVIGWIATVALVTLAFGAVAPALIVIGPSVAAGLPPGAGLLRGTPDRVVVSGETRPAVLYRAGAWLVLPALRNGCLDLRSP